MKPFKKNLEVHLTYGQKRPKTKTQEKTRKDPRKDQKKDPNNETETKQKRNGDGHEMETELETETKRKHEWKQDENGNNILDECIHISAESDARPKYVQSEKCGT